MHWTVQKPTLCVDDHNQTPILKVLDLVLKARAKHLYGPAFCLIGIGVPSEALRDNPMIYRRDGFGFGFG